MALSIVLRMDTRLYSTVIPAIKHTAQTVFLHWTVPTKQSAMAAGIGVKCTRLFCGECFDTCDECNKDFCTDCVEVFKCSVPGCNRKQCAECWKPGEYSDIATQKENNNVINCLECEKDWCFNCLPVSIKNEDCYGCLCISQGVEGR